MWRRWVLAALALVSGLAPVRGSGSAAIDAQVKQFMAGTKVPGLTVAVATGGQLRWSRGYGLSDVENSVPAKAATVYRTASVAKPITAVAAMQLAEQGLLDLDDAVQKYLPKFPVKPWPITTRALLAHLGGIRHYANEPEIHSTRHYANLTDPLEIFQRDPLVAEPGTAFHYTTYGYVVIGAVIEAAAGKRYSELVRERVFKPAGMMHVQSDDVYAIIPNRTRGYKLANGHIENCGLADTSNKIPGGGLSATAEDLVRFALAVKNGKLPKAETVKRMFEPQRLKGGRMTDYGLGWALIRDHDTALVGHSGGQQGVSTMLLMNQARGDVVAVMANLEDAPVDNLAATILRLLSQ